MIVPETLGEIPAEMMEALAKKYQINGGSGVAHRFVFDVIHAWAQHVRTLEPATLAAFGSLPCPFCIGRLRYDGVDRVAKCDTCREWFNDARLAEHNVGRPKQ